VRETTQYQELAEWLHKTSSEFYNSFEWVKGMSPAQMASHKVTQLLNVDCHQAYASGIIQKMGQAEVYRPQHQSYHKIIHEIHRDSDNRTNKVPDGVILRRLTTFTDFNGYRDNHRPLGKISNEVRGTLFYKKTNDGHLHNACKGSMSDVQFYHPWFWEVPTVKEILTVLQFAMNGTIDVLESKFKIRNSAVAKTIAKVADKCAKKHPKKHKEEPALRITPEPEVLRFSYPTLQQGSNGTTIWDTSTSEFQQVGRIGR